MCRNHWYMVPAAVQARVYASYRPEQIAGGTPSPEWYEAAALAVEAVARAEGRPTCNTFRRMFERAQAPGEAV